MGGARGAHSRQAGFTVLEILVAVTIMGLAYVAILQSFSLSARNITKMEAGRTELLSGSLAFERALLAMEQDNSGKKGEGALNALVEGAVYQVVQVDSEDGLFSTLKMKKK